MTVVVCHPTGNSNVRAVLRAYERERMLEAFWTTIAVSPTASQLFPSRFRRELDRRSFPEVRTGSIRVRPHRELLRLASRGLQMPQISAHENPIASVDAVYQHLDNQVAKYLHRASSSSVEAVYAYEDGALSTFRAARQTGRTTIYDLPIAHWRTLHAILEEERELVPEWSATINGLRDSASKLARKDEELEHADLILVASSFTKKSLTEHFGDRYSVIVTSYGAPAPRMMRPRARDRSEPLHIMYAGHMDQRKGFSYLVSALNKLEIPWRATLAGRPHPNAPVKLAAFFEQQNVEFLGHVPQRTLLEAMSRAHVFVFPSLVEGFGMVLTEAMSAGLPIITTAHTAAPDLIENGREGYIVPIRDSDAIAERLVELYEDESMRERMALAALTLVANRSWLDYEDAVINATTNNAGKIRIPE